MYLKLDKITKRYENKTAVDGLSLDIPRGVIYGMIGPNGAGKTTTIRMIMNIIVPDSGTILFDGREVDGSFRDRVGYLPEERGLYKKMTLREVITYLADLKGYPSKKTAAAIDPWLERMNLAEYVDQKVEELSKGMAQKLQFVTTVLHEPDIIILDEIFSGLDPINIELIKNVLLDLKREGRTILFSTHVMEQAEKLCDHICMISQGQKVLDGTIGDVKAQFGRNTVQIGFEGDGKFIRDLPGVREMTEFNNYVEVRLEDGTKPDSILKAAVDKLTISRFEVMEPSLYDIFIDTAKIDLADLHAEVGGDHV
ncbi:MAG: ATP-binding cassette domain-containing protein [candidate division Zixibacteria bacterium]|nr:ATP-binding cassette domain-containing protein [candidate division Zixibacteria bacterium]